MPILRAGCYQIRVGDGLGTIGLIIRTVEQQRPAIITAGHVVGGLGTDVYLAGGNTRIGYVADNFYRTRGTGVFRDIAIVEIDNTNLRLAYWQVFHLGGGDFQQIDVQGVSQVPTPGTAVTVCGAMSGRRTMTIRASGQSYQQEGTNVLLTGLTTMDFTDGGIQPGDSGGPVVYGNTLIGILGGVITNNGNVVCAYFTPIWAFQDFIHWGL